MMLLKLRHGRNRPGALRFPPAAPEGGGRVGGVRASASATPALRTRGRGLSCWGVPLRNEARRGELRHTLSLPRVKNARETRTLAPKSRACVLARSAALACAPFTATHASASSASAPRRVILPISRDSRKSETWLFSACRFFLLGGKKGELSR